jgi:hypothetical protein
VQLALRSLPLEVSTYPVMGDGASTLGAVLVFEDLTAQRQVARERREADQLELLTRVVARIADEIKNPLVSIRTFMELLEERYDDAGFRSHFAAVVGRDVRRLVQMFEKLAALVNEGDYKLEVVDVRLAVEECLLELGAQPVPAAGAEARLLTFTDESTQKHVSATYSYEGRTLPGAGRPRHAQEGDRVPGVVSPAQDARPGREALRLRLPSRQGGPCADHRRVAHRRCPGGRAAPDLRSHPGGPGKSHRRGTLRESAHHRGAGRAAGGQAGARRGGLHRDVAGRPRSLA